MSKKDLAAILLCLIALVVWATCALVIREGKENPPLPSPFQGRDEVPQTALESEEKFADFTKQYLASVHFILEEPTVETIVLRPSPYPVDFPMVQEEEGWENEDHWYVVVSGRDIFRNTLRTHLLTTEDRKNVIGIHTTRSGPDAKQWIAIVYAVFLPLAAFVYFLSKKARKQIQVLNKIHPIHFIICIFLIWPTLDMLVQAFMPSTWPVMFLQNAIFFFIIFYTLVTIWKAWTNPWQRAAPVALMVFIFYAMFNVVILADGVDLINEGQGSLILPLALPFQFIFAPLLLMLRTRSRKQRITLNLVCSIVFWVLFLFYGSTLPKLEPGLELSFIEGDSESWNIDPVEIGGKVLSPSWFRFDYLSEGPSLRCRQFGSLENAEGNTDPLDELVVPYHSPELGGYMFILSEGELRIPLALSNFPPTGYAIYKFEE